MIEEYIFYFGPESVFSHWYKSPFLLEGKTFCCVEQYIMYKKAILFKDEEMANSIVRSKDPRRQRRLGRQVRDFDRKIWQGHCLHYAIEANMAKFSQNDFLLKLLLETGFRSFAEASPYDRNWGIGLSASNEANRDPGKWRGRNMAGIALESARKKILEVMSKS